MRVFVAVGVLFFMGMTMIVRMCVSVIMIMFVFMIIR